MSELDEQILRDIFNGNGLNYSQIVGDELTTVSMELQDFNYSLKQVLALIATQVREARIDELEHIVSGSEYSADDFDWYEKTQDEYTGTRYYSEVRHLSKTDRIAELKAQQEEV